MPNKTYKSEILLLTHGGWGETLTNKLTMIIGQIESVSEIALNPSDTPEDYLQRVEQKIEKMPDNSLIITDIAGGTTTNTALRLSQKYKVHILSGLSAIMLMEAIMRQSKPFTEESIIEINEAAIMNCQYLKVPSLNSSKE